MLQEVARARQIPGEPRRRWFTSPALDLIVWYQPNNRILGFQLCYQKDDNEHALTWLKGQGFSHKKVDDGESPGDRFKKTPLLVPDGNVDVPKILTIFEQQSENLDPEIRELVSTRIREYDPA